MPQLMVSERGKEGERAFVCGGKETTIGRQEANAVSLSSPGVSRHHAVIVEEAEKYFLIDKESGNGTELNGKTITPNEKHPLRHGDVITIDTFDLRFVTPQDRLQKAEDEVTETDILEVKLLKSVLAALDRETVPSLEVLNGSEEGKKVHLTQDMTELVIGRDPECGFPIAEHVMSRRHAKIINRWGGIALRDLESKNGTFINNRRIVEEMLHDGDRIALGTIVLMFRNPQEINVAQFEPRPAPRPGAGPKVTADDVPLAEKKEKTIIPSPPEEEKPKEATEPSLSEKLVKGKKPTPYPSPKGKGGLFGGLTPTEIGMIGLGSLVLVFAVITLVNLLLS